MRYITIYIFLFIIMSCSRDFVAPKANAGSGECIQFKKQSIYCLRNWLTGEDEGGIWEQIGSTPQDLSSFLVGSGPCFEWDDKACGQYNLMYIVGDACCRDTAYVNPLKCCLIGTSICN